MRGAALDLNKMYPAALDDAINFADRNVCHRSGLFSRDHFDVAATRRAKSRDRFPVLTTKSNRRVTRSFYRYPCVYIGFVVHVC